MKEIGLIARLFWRAERGWFIAGIAASAATILAGIALLGLAGWFITASALAGLAGAGLSFNFFQPERGHPLPGDCAHGEPIRRAPRHA